MLIHFAGRMEGKNLERVNKIIPHAEIKVTSSLEEHLAAVEKAEILVTWPIFINKELVARGKNLKWIHAMTAGVEKFLTSIGDNNDILLTNARGTHIIHMSEHIIAIMLAFSRRLPEFLNRQKERKWDNLSVGELHGKTLGILGFGSIGGEVARKAKVFGMKVVALKRSPAKELPKFVDEVYSYEDGREGLLKVLSVSDFVVVLLPSTPETSEILGWEEFKIMKNESILINVARGDILKENDLIRALKEKVIAGAGLDVFTKEPLSGDSPLYALENVIITPHVAGSSPHYKDRALEIFYNNLEAYVKGEKLPTLIDPELGY